MKVNFQTSFQRFMLMITTIQIMVLLLQCASSQKKDFLKAAEKGDIAIVNSYIEARNDLNVREEKFGNSALHLASYEGHTEIVKLLLRNKLDPNIKATDNITPLIAACRNGHFETAKILLSSGSLINVQDIYGISALMAASYSGNKELVLYLLEKKANPDLTNNAGKKAIDKASSEEIKTILKTFKVK